jgi:hypothetical protein
MKIAYACLPALLGSLALAGCNPNGDPPLVFVQTHSLGIRAATVGNQATPELSLGYSDVDVAIVPVTTNGGKDIRSTTPDQSGHNYSDALSVLGQFEVGPFGTTPTPSQTPTLGKFFATGTAASKLAEGYRCHLGAEPGAANKSPLCN